MSDAPSTAKSRRQGWLVPLLLIGIVAGFLHPYLFQGRSMIPLELVPRVQPWARHAAEHPPTPSVENPLLDSLQQYYPRRVHFQRSLQQGRLPLWDANVYGGVPFDAIQQGAIFYPPAWALSALPAELQFGWSAFFHLSLAAIGGWLFFLRLGLRPPGALAGALAFALNGFIIVWLAYPNVTQWTLCWLPLIFYLWERGRQTDDPRWFAATSVGLAMAILGGHGQTATYVLLAWGIYALVGALSTRSKLAALARWAVLPAVPALLLGAAQVLPALEYLPQTDRGAKVTWDAVVRAGMPPAQLWTWLLPHLFGDETARFGTFPNWMPLSGKQGLAYIERSFYPGITVLALAATAWVTRKSQQRVFWYALGLVIASVLLAMGTWLYWPLWKIVPGFGNFTAVARILCLAGWGLACLAALGGHALSSSQPEERQTAIRALLGAVVLLGALAGAGHFIYGGAGPEELNRFLGRQGRPTLDALAMRDLTMAMGLLGAVAVLAVLTWPGGGGRSILPVGGAACLIALVASADLIGFGFKYNPKSDPALLHRDTPELRALREKPGAFRVLGDSPSGQPLDLRQRMPANLPAAFGLADIGGSDSFQPKRYLDWINATRKAAQDAGANHTSAPANLSAAAVRYYITGSDILFPGLKAVVGTGLQEDPRALPYARLHTSVRRVKDRAEMIGRLADPYRLELVALTEQPDGPTYHGRTSVTAFKRERISANHLRLTGEAPALGLLVVSEAFNAGWKARVDGRPTRVVPVDLLLLGIPIEEPGRHTIDLSYEPASLRAGLFVSLCALAVCLAIGASQRKRNPKEKYPRRGAWRRSAFDGADIVEPGGSGAGAKEDDRQGDCETMERRKETHGGLFLQENYVGGARGLRISVEHELFTLHSVLVSNPPDKGNRDFPEFAGLQLHASRVVDVIPEFNFTTQASGHIAEPDRCLGQHYHGTIFQIRDPAPRKCGWGKVIPFNDAPENIVELSAAITLEERATFKVDKADLAGAQTDLADAMEFVVDAALHAPQVGDGDWDARDARRYDEALEEALGFDSDAAESLTAAQNETDPQKKKKKVKRAKRNIEIALSAKRDALLLVVKVFELDGSSH